MRLGQKNPRVRQWARTGTRPLQFADQRTQSAYVFGAVAPQRGVGAALRAVGARAPLGLSVMPRADRQAMDQHLAEISRHVTPGCHAIVVMDRAGWHTTAKLTVPDNISLMCLPPRSPELNPVGHAARAPAARKKSGSSYARPTSQTGFLKPTAPSSTPAPPRGTASWPAPTRSAPSPTVIGPQSINLRSRWY